MAAYDFPTTPTPGQLWPVPAVVGATQYQWDNTVGVWNAVANFVRLNNALAYNDYKWPLADGLANQQLETDGAGNLYWDNAADPTIFPLELDNPFDGVQTTFNFVDPVTLNVYTPNPSTNLIVSLGAVVQDPFTAYTVAGSQITFTGAPLTGTEFSAFTVIQKD